MPRTKTFSEWVKDDPPPDLQAIIEFYGRSEVELKQDGALMRVNGGFSDIPDHIWEKYQSEMAAWQQRRRDRRME